ncbi:hypothetical protein [Tortoise microvirus 71]|nr:hypothetical protein [Tortoise microvirus 71]
MSWFGGSLNVSSGGHVYDRTTGTWAGETQGSAGDGIDRSVSSRVSTVWHDANGPVGVSFDRGSGESGGTGSVSRGHVASGPAADPVVAGGNGPGAGVANTDGPASGGGGPGSNAVVVGEKKPTTKPPLKSKLKLDVTEVSIGGDWWQPNPWFSDADQFTQRYGEGEVAETLFFLTTTLADVGWNSNRLGQHIGANVYHAEQATSKWLQDAPKRVNGPMPEQEPVDWGR